MLLSQAQLCNPHGYETDSNVPQPQLKASTTSHNQQTSKQTNKYIPLIPSAVIDIQYLSIRIQHFSITLHQYIIELNIA